ncbi:coordinator of PRMT5 and differentiation stimulator isoform X2 [Rhineura floridana]|uniref:coordinator of PRMT5 and differentiation stimulator isoform X2 n=1 Tax=Rhineura floridana TaxID=261503 RepID=UPI002AC82BDF|nr:coordinator of PRMT5 and differentiation stimulator isoform X2 [Rhineura floridana]
METAGLLDLPGRILEQREEVEVKRVKTFSWRPGKGLEEGVVEKVTSAVEEFEDLKSDCEDWDSGDEDCSVLTDTAFLEVETISHYEEEDWDKELADSENNNPYGRF